MRKFLTLAIAVLLSACGVADSELQRSVKNDEVPTAFFVLFEPNSAVPTAGSEKVIREVFLLMSRYKTLSAKVVAHNSTSEVSPQLGSKLDEQRSTFVVGKLVGQGISAARLGVLNMGAKESMAAIAGGDESVDRRVEIIMIAPQNSDPAK